MRKTYLLAVIAMLTMGWLPPRAAGQDEVPPPQAATESVQADTQTDEGGADEVVGEVTLGERLQAGGRTMIFLGLCSLVVLTFSLERLFGLKRSVIAPSGLVEKAMTLWNAKDHDAILSLCDRNPSTLATILRTFVRHQHCTPLELSQLAGDIAGRDMRMHLQRAYPIAVAATLAPLLGLLGTVIGMIESFEVVTIVGSMGDASILAGSISKALVTTATGLMIAVPALAMYHLFKSRTSSLTALLEEDTNEILTSWFMDKPKSQES